VAVAGACLGGTLAFLLACTSTRVSAALAFHAPLVYPELDARRPIQPLELALNLGCPLFACYGAEDGLVPPADVERLRRTLGAAAKELELVTIPDAAHAFLDEDAAAFAPAGAEEAWRRALDFLRAAS
jgi:carboxymethylenebutenolidase